MAVCTFVKLEAYRERGSHMRRVATETKGGSEVLWDGGGCRSSTADAVCCGISNFFFKDATVYTGRTFVFCTAHTIQWGKKYSKHNTARRTNKCESAHVTEKMCFHRSREAFLHQWLLFLKRKEGKKTINKKKTTTRFDSCREQE